MVDILSELNNILDFISNIPMLFFIFKYEYKFYIYIIENTWDPYTSLVINSTVITRINSVCQRRYLGPLNYELFRVN